MTTLNREDFLSTLELTAPGLTTKDVVEQSSCFCFKDGKIYTFNEEICCCHKSPIDVTAAVRAKPLVEILRKLSEEEIDVDVNGEHLLIAGKKKTAGIRMEAEILLPFDSVEVPEKWKKLDEHFCEAVGWVQSCASDDASKFVSTCIHIHPDYVEACDNYQAMRYKVKTGVKKPILVRRDSLKHIVNLEMNKFSETGKWIHFKNSSGLILSCLRSLDEYPPLEEFLKIEGEPITLPKGLAETVDKAQVFSGENQDKNQVMVELRPGRCRIKAEGASGFYREIKRLQYEGPALKFFIDPNLLAEMAKKYTNCEVNEDHLLATGERFVFVTSLGQEGEQEEEEKEDES